eukprot:TRINITY_DN61898_c0_g1_i1.p1 TRINITY_DN61898_c0_g1~~TRINITY_DN61898_c0_g1_i1.p1  ORF type:complete len:108 (-),score=32.29 TRINITY_DN61898_c0_g1_i1:2-295(-)
MLRSLVGSEMCIRDSKATAIGSILLRAFNTSTGLPHTSINLKHKRHASSQWSGGNVALSEIGTMQLEFRTLSYHCLLYTSDAADEEDSVERGWRLML